MMPEDTLRWRTTPKTITFPLETGLPLHVAHFRANLPTGKVYCARCETVIALADHASPCPGKTAA